LCTFFSKWSASLDLVAVYSNSAGYQQEERDLGTGIKNRERILLESTPNLFFLFPGPSPLVIIWRLVASQTGQEEAENNRPSSWADFSPDCL
jgi:hypothetical protein